MDKLCSLSLPSFAMLAGRVVILLLVNFSAIVSSFDAGQEQFANEIARISADWLIWSTITASSILYSLTLYRNHSGIRDFIHERSMILYEATRLTTAEIIEGSRLF